MSDPATYLVKYSGKTVLVQALDKVAVRNFVNEQIGLSIKPATVADVIAAKGEVTVYGQAPKS